MVDAATIRVVREAAGSSIGRGARWVTGSMSSSTTRSGALVSVGFSTGPISTRRGAPPELSFRFDVATVHRGLNFTLSTTLGDLDLFGEIAGGGRHEDLLADTVAL